MKNIPERLSSLIKTLGLDVAKFARRCKIPYPTVQKYLRNERTPTSENLEKMFTHTGMNIQWLLTGVGPMFLKQEPSWVYETPGLYLENDRLKKICQMVMNMDDEGQVNLLRYIEDQQLREEERRLLRELLEERKKIKETG